MSARRVLLLAAALLACQAENDPLDCDPPCPADEVCLEQACHRLCDTSFDCNGVGRCNDGACFALAETGERCGETEDCLAKHECIGDTCRLIDGEACEANADCIGTCIAALCTQPAAMHGVCDDEGDCAATLACNGAECLLADGQTCGVDADCRNVCIVTTCASRSDFDGPCDAVTDCKDPAALCDVGACRRYCPGESCDGTDDDCDNAVDDGCGAICGLVRTFFDDFGDGGFGAGWVSAVSGDATAVESGGVAVLTPGQAAAAAAELVSTRTFDLRGDEVAIEVTAATTQDPNIEQYFGIEGRGGTRYAFQIANNSLRAIRKNGGSSTTLGSTTWSLANHHFLRVRATGGAGLALETSPDRSAWQALATTSALFPLDAIRIVVGAASVPGIAVAPGAANFDNLNIAAGGYSPGGLVYCNAAALRDDFADPGTARYSDTSSGNGSVTVSGGVLALTPPSDVIGKAVRRSVDAFDLTDTMAFVRLLAAPSSADARAVFAALGGGGNVVAFHVGGGNLAAVYDSGGGPTTVATVPYDSSRHRFLRLRERGGTTFWEVSADVETWSIVGSVATPFGLGAITVELAAEALATVSVTPVRFDDLNLGP